MKAIHLAGLEPATFDSIDGSCSNVRQNQQRDKDEQQSMVAPPVAQLSVTLPQVGPELARVVEAWPPLPESMREAILKLIG
jgi:hypothetical protein